MKKLMFVGFMFVFLVLIAEETNNNESNWISYDGWVTGPGANENNKYTYLLPFGYAKIHCNPTNENCQLRAFADDRGSN